MRRSLHRVIVVIVAVVTAVALAGPVAHASARTGSAGRPYVHGGRTVPTYSYANAIRESVWVDTKLDDDGDGKPDRVAVDIVRPRVPARSGVKVPVIMEASPYYSCCGRGNESQLKKYDADGTITSMPLYYDNYFVPRGYAFVGVDLPGTNRSTGCPDVGGPEEIGGAKAVIDWLNGRATAHYADGSPAVAAWTTGTVGMIGKSWDGTIANGVAATGVRGLATIVPVSGISSWYDYMRLDGVLRSTDYPGWLASFVNGRPNDTCATETAALNTAGDDATGDVNRFWDQRDYVARAGHVRASVFIAHGLNDQNVFARNFADWWRALGRHHVPRMMWLHQEGHTDPFDIRRSAWVRQLHLWFDHWLQHLPNGVMHQPTVQLERDPNQWHGQSSYPAPGAHRVRLSPAASSSGAGTLGRGRGSGTQTITDNTALTETQAVSDPNTARTDRLAFLTGRFTRRLHVSGTPTVRLHFKASKPDTELTAKLVDYGTATRDQYLANDLSGITTLDTSSCWGESTAADSACYRDTAEVTKTTDYGVLSRGWTDGAHHVSLRRYTPLTPGRWYTMTIRLQPQDQILAKGHTLGLVLSLSDTENTDPQTTGATVTVDLAHSSLSLPVAGPAALGRPSRAPHVTVTASPHATTRHATNPPVPAAR